MALNWDIRNLADDSFGIINPDENGRGELHPTTHAMIWSTLFVGIGAITEKTADEFAARIRLFERVHGAQLREQVDGVWVDKYLTAEDVRAHIGLTTNVGWETRTKWLKRSIHADFFSKPDPKF